MAALHLHRMDDDHVTRRIVLELREDDYAWLLKNIVDVDVPWKTPLPWQRIRMRLVSALVQAGDE